MLQLILYATAACAIYIGYIYSRNLLESRRVQMREDTKEPPKIEQSWFKYGLDLYHMFIKYFREGKSLEHGEELYNTYGDTYSFYLLGQTFITTRDPENIKAMLATQFTEFSLGKSRYTSFVPLLGEGIFTHLYGGGEEGEPWRHSRTMLRPQFTRQQIQDLAVLEQFVQNLLARIPSNETFDLQELFFKFTMDTATDFLFGESVNSLLPDCPPEETKFYKYFSRGAEILLLRALLGDFHYFQSDRVEFNEICTSVHSYIDKFTQKAIRLRDSGKPTSYGSGGKYVVLEEMAQALQDPVRLRSELLNILLAGRDTTAGLLSICFHQLARHKDVWMKLRKEILESLGGRKPTYEDIKSMKYLRYVLNETLRLYPIVPENSRTAVVTTTLPRGGGPDGKEKIFIKKGTTVSYSPWSLHRRDVYGPDPEAFRPSRWETLRPVWDYLPFNGGPRICLGQQYALTEASYVTIRLLQTFEDIENRDPIIPFMECLTLTLSSKTGTIIALKPVSCE